MDKQEFMDIVYSMLESDPVNIRSNRIIEAADEYAESVQLGTSLAEVGTDCERLPFEEVKEMLKKSIDETANINEALEKTVQFIYSKGYEDGSQSAHPDGDCSVPQKQEG
jgi:hypothetical protein